MCRLAPDHVVRPATAGRRAASLLSVRQTPERHVEPLGRLREPALNGSEPSTLGLHARLLGGEHAGDFGGLRAAEALARLHHVFGRERSAELRLGERHSGVVNAVKLRRLGVDALRLVIGNLARLERMPAAEIDELGGEMVADPERHVGEALQRIGKLSRGRVIRIDFRKRALVVEHEILHQPRERSVKVRGILEHAVGLVGLVVAHAGAAAMAWFGRIAR